MYNSATGPSSEGIARMSVGNSSNTQEAGTSWAQYLQNRYFM